MWETLEEVVRICEEERIDLLLIAGDLFHRQPLLRELKEVNAMFQILTHTKVVLIAGNHDYIKSNSFYKKFQWCEQVYPLFGEHLQYVSFPELGTCVYGLSYGQREITEPLYDRAFPLKKQPIEILLAHGGDKKHIPFKREQLLDLGYDYIALGHIHRPMELESQKMYYAGALEPTDIADTGMHGFLEGKVENGKVRVSFVPFAGREYIHEQILVTKEMSGRNVREKIAALIEERGVHNLYKICLVGQRDPDILFDLSGMDRYGNIVEIFDNTRPAYDYQRLKEQNADNLLGKFIENMQGALEGSMEYQALAEGVTALLESR